MLYRFKAADRRLAHQRLGFWSINFQNGAVTWDATTAAIHGKPAGHMPSLHEALGFFQRDDRARVVDAALSAFESRTVFDIEAAFEGGGHTRVRLIGGRGYCARSDAAELHGIIEVVPPASPHPHEAAPTTAQMRRIVDASTWLDPDGEARREPIAATAMIESLLHAHIERNPEYARTWVTVASGIELDGDPREVELVLDTLVGNALRFSAARSIPRVRITASSDAGRTVVHVTDNGVGLVTRHHGPAFEGGDVGLAIARHLVERHGGAIWAEGEPDKGATFSFYL